MIYNNISLDIDDKYDHNLHYKYFSLVGDFKVTQFLSENPHFASEFRKYSIQYNKYVDNLYKMYVLRYVKRKIKYIKKKFLKHTFYIHNHIYIPSLIDSYKKTIITKDIIRIYLENLQIYDLIHYLNKK